MAHGKTASKHAITWRGLLLLALAAYLLLATTQIGLPGLNYDEALDSVPAMQFVLGEPLDSYAQVHVLGRAWPLTVMPYVGVTTTYLLMPVFALFGPSLVTLRFTLIGLGTVTLIVAWWVVRTLFDERIAGVAILLLAVSPAFVFWTRMGSYVSLPLVSLALIVVWSLHRWYGTGRAGYLIGAAFAFGLGLTTKILFVWLPLALGVGWVMLAPRDANGRLDWLRPLRCTRPGAWVAAGVAACVGAAPFLAFNLLHAGETVQLLRRNLVETELYGVSNLDLASNLRIVFAVDLVQLLDGAWFADLFGHLHRSPLVLPALGIALVLIAALAWTRRLPRPRMVALLLILIVAITAQSAVTVSSLGANHLAILWPWPQTLLAVAAVSLVDWARDARIRGARIRGAPRVSWLVVALAVLLVAAPLASDLRTTLAYHVTLQQTGGRGQWSDAIYTLAADLDAPDAPQAVALDWGFKRNLQLVTGNRVIPEDGFTYSQQPDETYRRWAEGRLDQGPALYIEHTPAYTAFGGHRELLEEAAYRTGRELTLWREYTQRDGTPVYRVYSIASAEPLAAMPEHGIVQAASFGDEIRLLGHDPLEQPWQAGVRVRFHVYWQAIVRPEGEYKVFVHLAGTDERVVAQHDGVPMLWAFPTSAWQPDEIVADRIVLDIPEDLPAGQYSLWLGMYDEVDGVRLPAVESGTWLPDDRLLLAEVVVTQ